MSTPVLEVRGLEKRYGRVHALAGIDLTVERGAVYGFLGPNGAGKTTLIRIVAGLVSPTAGRVCLHGLDLAHDRLEAARGLRTLVEVPAFYPALSGRQNLALMARLARAQPQEVDRLLEAVGLAHARDRAVGGYSLGMRQRLGIAQALLGQPDLVVLDEPMNGLDPAAMREMRELVRHERERGVTFFLSSHQLHDVQLLCDRVGIVHRGRMVAEGEIARLLGQSISGFRLETADNVRALALLQERLPAARPVREEDGTLRVTGGSDLAGELQRALLGAGLALVRLEPQRESLERYFLDKTEGVMG
ncbi:MAG: ABC transporter ATP-binding protein [Planctomycetia bacterium]